MPAGPVSRSNLSIGGGLAQGGTVTMYVDGNGTGEGRVDAGTDEPRPPRHS